MTTAIFGLVGVVVGPLLTALLNFFLQRAAEERLWAHEDETRSKQRVREDHTRHHQERLSAYRDILAAIIRTHVEQVG